MIAAVVVVVALGAAVVGIVVARGSSTPAPTTTATNLGVATVETRDLAAYTTQAGTVGFGDPITVSEGGAASTASAATSGSTGGSAAAGAGAGGGASGSGGGSTGGGTVTAIADAGSLVPRGGVLYRVDTAPRVLFSGEQPAYRDMGPTSTPGDDIRQLEENLVALGFDPDHAITIDGVFDDADIAAVDRWQASFGLTQTGTVALGTVVFVPGPSRVGNLKTSVGSTVRTGSGILELTPTDTVVTAFTPATAGTLGQIAPKGTEARTGTVLFTVDGVPTVSVVTGTDASAVPANAHTVAVPPGLTVADHPQVSDGAVLLASSPVLDLTRSRRVVSTTVKVSDRGKLQVGEAVIVTFPDGVDHGGHITDIGQVATKGSGANAAATVPVSIALDDPGVVDPALVSTPVQVQVPTQVAKAAAAVPTTALVALKEGGYAVQLADTNPDGSVKPGKLVKVDVGLYADSYVQVSGVPVGAKVVTAT
ncbi:MAG: peptidoglycan-binding domain-containing protein [Acidimicrobiales bacterium]